MQTLPVQPQVEVDDLKVSFGSVVAVAGVTFTVPAGGATALLGRNGAGKSTTMRVLAGVVPPPAGRPGSVASTSPATPSGPSGRSATAPTWAASCPGPPPGSTCS